MPNFNNLPTWLPPLIARKKLTIEEFAREAGLTRASVYNYLTDRSRPSEDSMLAMCRVLGVSLEEGLKQYTPKPLGSGATKR